MNAPTIAPATRLAAALTLALLAPAALAQTLPAAGTTNSGTYTLPSSNRYLWTVIDAEPALAASAAVFNPGLSIRQGPATGACGSCHINSLAKAHVQQNSAGGVETCALCHGPGKSAEAHSN